jgi:hypothetical protein
LVKIASLLQVYFMFSVLLQFITVLKYLCNSPHNIFIILDLLLLFYCATGRTACTTESHSHIKCNFCSRATHAFPQASYQQRILQAGNLNNLS